MRLLREIKYYILALILWSVGLSQSVLADTNAQILNVRITHQGDVTHFIFDLSQSIRYYYKYTSKPARLMLEMQQATLVCALPQSSLASSPVIDYQAVSQDSSTRFSFDFKYPLTPKIYFLPPAGQYGYRLIVELKQAAGGPMATANSTENPVNNHTESALPKLVAPRQTEAAPVSAPTPTPNPTKALSTPVTVATTALTVSKPAANHPIMVVIDPGHGGKDPGATGMSGVKEKMVVLAISKLIQQILIQDPHYRARMTRSTDVYISLRQRLAIARGYKPDLFVAIHADAAYKNSAVGASVFALSERGATSEMARWLAQKENASELVDGVFVEKDKVLRSVLLDLSQSHAITVSLEIGQAILRQLSTVTHLHYARVEQAAFVVLKSPDIPSLLVETGYLTNPVQEHQLSNPAYQRRIAMAIVQGIKNYFARYPG